MLKLELVAAPGADGIQTVGKGKSQAHYVLMQPSVTAWRDGDSVAAWEGAGSLIGLQ